MFRAMFSPIIWSGLLYLQLLVMFTNIATPARVVDDLELQLQFQLIHDTCR
jgi:hypothetical protein